MAALGCGGGNSLSGSASELFALDVSRVTCLRNAEAFQVNYFGNRGRDVDLVASLTVRLDGVELRAGKSVALQGEAAPGHARATVIHQAAAEPVRVFANVKDGDLELDEGGVAGTVSQGNFSLSFQDGSGYGAGRTLEGDFEAETLDGGFGPEVGEGVPVP